MDNKIRLKQVKNLAELIQFRIKTVGDNLMEDGNLLGGISKTQGLQALSKVVDPLLPHGFRPNRINKQKRRGSKMKEDSLLAAYDESFINV